MNKIDFKKFLGTLWCAMNCATTLEQRIAIMKLLEVKRNARQQWAKFSDAQDTRKAAMRALKRAINAGL